MTMHGRYEELTRNAPVRPGKWSSCLVVLLLLDNVLLISASQQCRALKGTPLELCRAAGYNTTYPISNDIYLSNSAKSRIKSYISYALNLMKNCSVAQMGEAVFCSEFAPYCRAEDSAPFLPCRRVCSEYLKRCEGTIARFWLEFSIGTCTLLPNATAESGKCFEPPGFNLYHNESTKGLLEGDCSPLLYPICDNVGFNHTILSMATQVLFYRHAYGKPFTNTSADKDPTPNSFVARLQKTLDAHPKCSFYLRQLFCVDNFPPCFRGESFALYTVCRSVCHKIANLCPELLKSNMIRYITDCEIRTAPGDTAHGLCRQTQWPPPARWMRWFKDIPTPLPTQVVSPTIQSTPDVNVYVAAVVVPVVVMVIVIFVVLAWRQRKLPTICLRGHDKEDLVPAPDQGYVVHSAMTQTEILPPLSPPPPPPPPPPPRLPFSLSREA